MPDLITSRTNPRVKQLRAAASGQARLAQGLIAIEGAHLLEAALASHQAIKTIFLADQNAERTPLLASLPRDIEVLRLAPDVFASSVETQSPQGIAALMVPPTPSPERFFERTPLLLIAVNLQDPGNLGTLIRSAVAFGATGLLTTPGTVSPWNGKAMRASAGSVFSLPIAPADEPTLALLATHKVNLLAAVKHDAQPIHTLDLTRPTAFLIGNEGAGLPPDWLARAHTRVTIPTPGPVESLNAAVAGSLLLYEAARQRTH